MPTTIAPALRLSPALPGASYCIILEGCAIGFSDRGLGRHDAGGRAAGDPLCADVFSDDCLMFAVRDNMHIHLPDTGKRGLPAVCRAGLASSENGDLNAAYCSQAETNEAAAVQAAAQAPSDENKTASQKASLVFAKAIVLPGLTPGMRADRTACGHRPSRRRAIYNRDAPAPP